MSRASKYSELAKTYHLIGISTVLAALLVLAHGFLPDRKVELIPRDTSMYTIFYDAESGGTTTANWVDQDRASFECHSLPGGWQFGFCGIVFRIGDLESPSDLSRFDTFHAKITIDGTAQLLRIFTRTYIPGVSQVGNWGSMKSLNAVMTKEEAKDIELVPGDWSVSDYWRNRYKPTRENTYVDFSRVHEFGIDIMPPIPLGTHHITVHSILAAGEWVHATQWYLGVALGWLLLNFVIIVKRLYNLHRRVSLDSHRIDTLALYSDELRDESEKYKQLSAKDNLTGALNRNGLLQFINNSFPEGHFSAQLGLVVIDLDHFKKVNDEKGHDMGDEVLRSVSSTIRNIVRQEDGFCRWGGEEFVLICPNTNERDTFIIAEKIRQAISSILFEYDGKSFHITASLGVGLAKPNESFDDLFKRVDKALYEAKALGRNCVNKAA